MPARPTPNTARRAAGATAGLLLALAGAGVAFGPAAAAVDDPARPDYTVTHGPSCHPGGVEIEVVAGAVPYAVVLATTRQPQGEDSAELAPGETVRLHTGDVDWGETIDSRLEFTALDGSGDAFVDELVPYSFTRPSWEDCAAIAPPPAAGSSGAAPAPAASEDPPAPDAGAPAPGRPAAVPERSADRPGLQVQPASVQLPVSRGPAWPLIAGGLVLAGTAGGLVVAGGRRARGRGPMAGA